MDKDALSLPRDSSPWNLPQSSLASAHVMPSMPKLAQLVASAPTSAPAAEHASGGTERERKAVAAAGRKASKAAQDASHVLCKLH
eukprot:1159683-Pelagomonas_calceolata.AAC.3